MDDWITEETVNWLKSQSPYPWRVWRGETTRRWWAVPLWPSTPAEVIDAGHHRELQAAMRELEQRYRPE